MVITSCTAFRTFALKKIVEKPAVGLAPTLTVPSYRLERIEKTYAIYVMEKRLSLYIHVIGVVAQVVRLKYQFYS